MSIKAIILSGAFIAAGLTAVAPAQAGTEDYLGEVKLVGYNFCPRGTIAAEGQTLPIADNTALFSLYGTTYGGDGRDTFGLPDLQGRTVIGGGQGDDLTPRSVGNKGGTEKISAAGESVGRGRDVKAAERHRLGSNMQPFLTLKYCIMT